jgi:hypothetical protein
VVLGGAVEDDVEPDDGDGGHDASAAENRREGREEQERAQEPEASFIKKSRLYT